MQFTDRRGPYEDQEQCFARVEEMVRDITPTLPPVPSQFYFKCKEAKEGVRT